MAGPRQDRDIPKAKLNRQSIAELKFVFSYLKPYRKYFYGGLLFISLSAFSTMAFPFLMGKMIGAVSQSQVELPSMGQGWLSRFSLSDAHWPLDLTLILIFAQLTLQTLFSFMRVYLLSRAGTNASADLRKSLYAKLIALPMGFFSTQRVGDLSSRIGSDTGQIQDTVSFILAEFCRQVNWRRSSILTGIRLREKNISH